MFFSTHGRDRIDIERHTSILKFIIISWWLCWDAIIIWWFCRRTQSRIAIAIFNRFGTRSRVFRVCFFTRYLQSKEIQSTSANSEKEPNLWSSESLELKLLQYSILINIDKQLNYHGISLSFWIQGGFNMVSKQKVLRLNLLMRFSIQLILFFTVGPSTNIQVHKWRELDIDKTLNY